MKKDYDEPETANVDLDLTVDLTIAQLRSMAVGTAPIEITGDSIIAGIIVADDESGTFYKQMIIQDSTAGIAINLDISNYNSDYPIGRRVFIKLKGLYIANDGDDNYSLGVKTTRRSDVSRPRWSASISSKANGDLRLLRWRCPLYAQFQCERLYPSD